MSPRAEIVKVAGAAGALLAQTTGFASLDVFALERSADLMLILVIGGVGWLYGGIAGAVVFKLMHDVISGITPQYWTFWIGLFLVVLVMGGVLGLLTWLAVSLWPAGLFGVPAALTGWLAPMCLCAALSVVWQAWAANNGQVHVLNAIRLAQAAAVTGLQILAAWVNPAAGSLVVAQIAGTAVAVCVAVRLLRASCQ